MGIFHWNSKPAAPQDTPAPDDGFSGNDFWQEPPKPAAEVPPIAFEEPKTKAYSIVALITGILGVLCCCTGWSSLLFGALGILFAILAKKHLGFYDGLALAGLILGIIACVLGASELIAVYALPSSSEFSDGFLEEFQKAFEDMWGDGLEESPLPDTSNSF